MLMPVFPEGAPFQGSPLGRAGWRGTSQTERAMSCFNDTLGCSVRNIPCLIFSLNRLPYLVYSARLHQPDPTLSPSPSPWRVPVNRGMIAPGNHIHLDSLRYSQRERLLRVQGSHSGGSEAILNSSDRGCTAPRLPLWGSWHGIAVTERANLYFQFCTRLQCTLRTQYGQGRNRHISPFVVLLRLAVLGGGSPRGASFYKAPLGSSLVTFCLYRKLPLGEPFPLQQNGTKGLYRKCGNYRHCGPSGGYLSCLATRKIRKKGPQGRC